MRNRYTETEIKTILKNLCVIVDTREQVWINIEDYFKKQKIQYRRENLNQGDYSICIVSNEETKPLGITRDLYFDNEIVIERKASIDEVAGNMKEPDRTRLKKEFSYLKSRGVKVHFFLEDKDFDINLRQQKYRSQYNPKALYGSIKTFEAEFGFTVRPVSKDIIGSEIYYTLYYHVKNQLLGK